MNEAGLLGLILGAVIGLVIGAGGAYLWMRYGRPGAGGSDSARERAYREEVADHFVRSAELVNRLTDSYKEVFDHLRHGAENLVEEETLRERLSQESDKNVTLHLIGYRKPEAGSRPSGKSPRGDANKRTAPGDDTN